MEMTELEQSAKVKDLIDQLFGRQGWVDAGQNRQGLSTELRLSGWGRSPCVVVLGMHAGVRYEFAVLVTSTLVDVRIIAQY